MSLCTTSFTSLCNFFLFFFYFCHHLLFVNLTLFLTFPPFSFVTIPPIPLSHQEVQVACALASALHSLCPTRSHSVNDSTWLSGQCFHSANSPWRNHVCPLYLSTEKNISLVSDAWYRHSVARLIVALHDLIFKMVDFGTNVVVVLMNDNVSKQTKKGSFVTPSAILYAVCTLICVIYCTCLVQLLRNAIHSKKRYICVSQDHIIIVKVKVFFFFDGSGIIYSKVTENHLKSPQPRLCKSLEKLHRPKAHT